MDEPTPRLYLLLRRIARFTLGLFTKIEVEGLDYLPPQGSSIVVTNHLHWLDTIVALAVLPRWGTVFACDVLARRPVIGTLLRRSNSVVFVACNRLDRGALREAMHVLEAGRVIGIAPEGKRSQTGGLAEGEVGAAYIALKSQAPVVPLAMSGHEKALRSLIRLRRHPIRAAFGKPFILKDDVSIASGAQLEQGTQMIMLRLAELLPPENRGVFAQQDEAG